MADTGGLLGFMKSAEGQGLLSAAFGGLAGARRGTPLNNIGRGGLAGIAGYANAQDRQTEQEQLAKRNQMLDLQFKNAQRDFDATEGIRKAGMESMRSPEHMALANGLGPTVANANTIPTTQPGFDTQGFVSRVMGIDPMKGIALQHSMAKESPFNKIDPKDFTQDSIAKFAQSKNYGDLVPARKKELAPSGQIYDPYSVAAGSFLPDPNKPFSMGQNGQFVPNVPYQNYEIAKSRAGGTNVKIENKMGESIAGQIGPMVRETWTAANGAVQTADAANRLVQAVDGGKLYAGPLAGGRLTAAQVASTLGMGGKDEAEKIANTRQAITSLSNLTLQGRKQMTGQGAITESEGKLAERAMSGDINMTPAELRQLANAARRAAKFTYEQHQTQLGAMQQDPNLVNLSKFYRTPQFPDMPGAGGASGGVVDFGSLK